MTLSGSAVFSGGQNDYQKTHVSSYLEAQNIRTCVAEYNIRIGNLATMEEEVRAVVKADCCYLQK
jgi:hypothetical protein